MSEDSGSNRTTIIVNLLDFQRKFLETLLVLSRRVDDDALSTPLPEDEAVGVRGRRERVCGD